MEFTLLPYKPGYDHQSFRLGARGYGFIGNSDRDGVRMVGLERCPKCERENYYASVWQCRCAWCGFDAKPFIPSPLPPPPTSPAPSPQPSAPSSGERPDGLGPLPPETSF